MRSSSDSMMCSVAKGTLSLQVDFVGHAQNPFFKRGLPKGEALRLAASLQHLRVAPKTENRPP